MNRDQFIKSLTMTGITLIAMPNFAFKQTSITSEELIGKGKPKLFGEGYSLREAAHFAFLKMKSEALKSGINIHTVSSYRSFNHQKRIWNRKFEANRKRGLSEYNNIRKIIEYSTIPGTSRHHWGTDIDIIDANIHAPKHVLQAQHFHRDGSYIKLKHWLDTHANSFGFYLVYTADSDRKGFKYEPWHYTYKPLSKTFLKDYLKMDIHKMLNQEQLLGQQSFTTEFIESYLKENILDINPELL